MFVFFVLLSKIISWREMKEPAEVQQDRTAIFFSPLAALLFCGQWNRITTN